ncbi:MAG: acyltransferase [Vicingaceae bacterium]
MYIPDSQDIFSIQNQQTFETLALAIFEYQYNNVPVYKKFCNLLGKTPLKVKTIYDIPFLPIEAFKNHKIITLNASSQIVFESSGTTNQLNRSKHFVADVEWYKNSFLNTFIRFYGNINEYCIIALLPSYLEREGSSLIYMCNELIIRSAHPKSGFYLNEYDKLKATLKLLETHQQKTLLIGVSFALMDFAELYNGNPLKNTIIMETGGMKGRREEITRENLHTTLKKAFGVSVIHSEYGMTECLSQAYAKKEGIFETPPWMQVFIRETNDPFNFVENKVGGINIIDLANVHSCAFIATQDLGIKKENMFEVLGRFDNSEIRGCNLLIV